MIQVRLPGLLGPPDLRIMLLENGVDGLQIEMLYQHMSARLAEVVKGSDDAV
jgi:hypothetical protein